MGAVSQARHEFVVAGAAYFVSSHSQCSRLGKLHKQQHQQQHSGRPGLVTIKSDYNNDSRLTDIQPSKLMLMLLRMMMYLSVCVIVQMTCLELATGATATEVVQQLNLDANV